MNHFYISLFLFTSRPSHLPLQLPLIAVPSCPPRHRCLLVDSFPLSCHCDSPPRTVLPRHYGQDQESSVGSASQFITRLCTSSD